MADSIHSSLRIACSLNMPVFHSCLFKSTDLMGTGIVVNSNLPIIESENVLLPKEGLLKDLETIWTPPGYTYDRFKDELKSVRMYGALEIFDLDVHLRKDHEHVVLRLKETADIYKPLMIANKFLARKYKIKEKYPYEPCIKLAKLKPGTAEQYLASKTLRAVLKDSLIDFEDLRLAYGKKEDGKYKLIQGVNLTTYFVVDRFFREENISKELEEDGKLHGES